MLSQFFRHYYNNQFERRSVYNLRDQFQRSSVYNLRDQFQRRSVYNLRDQFQRRSVYNLRDSEGKLTLPKPSTNYLKRSFSYSGAMLWNNMLKSLKNAVSVNHF